MVTLVIPVCDLLPNIIYQLCLRIWRLYRYFNILSPRSSVRRCKDFLAIMKVSDPALQRS